MKLRQLGSTDIMVSPIGLGTVKFGRNTAVKYPTPFNLPTDQQILSLLATARDLNINLLDTAPAYGSSEERIGKLLTNRHNWIIASKVGEQFINDKSSFNFTSTYINQTIENTLKKLRTDYLDILLIHSNGNDQEIIEKYDVFTTLASLKQQGLIRAFGMSSKTINGGLLTIQHADVAMVTYNPFYTKERLVIDTAKQLNKGILIKKALASGHINQLNCSVSSALQHITDIPGITSAIVGSINEQHLRQNVSLIT